MPAPIPAFNRQQAARFRKAFGAWCEFYGATHAHVGEALEAHQPLRGRFGDGEGAKAVDNAMLKSAKLAHGTARRLVVALLISKPALLKANADDPVPDEAVGLLVELGALDTDRPAYPAAFILPFSINAIARNLAESAALQAGMRKGRDELAKGIAKRLQSDAPFMARDFCDVLERRGGSEGKGAFPQMDGFAFQLFGNAYISPAAGPAWGPEFAVLYRIRPELGLGHVIDLSAIERGRETKRRDRRKQ